MRGNQEPNFCASCSEEIQGKIKYMLVGKPIALFCTSECYDNFTKGPEVRYENDYQKGYNAAVDAIIERIERQQKFYRDQYSRVEAVTCSIIIRDIKEKFIKE